MPKAAVPAVSKAANGNGSALALFDPSKFDALSKNMAHGASTPIGFLKFNGKTGEWTVGQDEEPVDPDTRFYVDPNGFVHGWQCWADTDIPGVQTELLGDVWVSMFDPLPPRPEEVPENGREWAELKGMSLVMEGENRPLKYSTTSHGGRNAFANLWKEYRPQYTANPSCMIAVVTLTEDSYKHKNKTYGKVYTPVFVVVDWVDHLPEVTAMPKPTLPVPPAKKAPAKKAPAKAAKKA